MTADQITHVAAKYDRLLAERGIPTHQQDTGKLCPVMWYNHLTHARWMCQEISGNFLADLVQKDQSAKAERWLCFVQGVLWCEGILTIDEMREDNR